MAKLKIVETLPPKDWRAVPWLEGAEETFKQLLAIHPTGFYVVAETLDGERAHFWWPPLDTMAKQLVADARDMWGEEELE